jgi:hypothetical protein
MRKSMFQFLLVASLLLHTAAFCQGKDPAKAAPRQTSQNTPPDGAVKVDKMPADVVEVRTDVFRQVDKNGKAWIYRRMPFGIFKSPETENMKQILADPPDRQNVKELPDGTLEFTKLTPFGVGRYTRKKADLTDEEKEFWEQAKAREAKAKKSVKEQQK